MTTTRLMNLGVAALAAVAAALGLRLPDLYAADAATTEMLRGFDLVTLALVVPALLLLETGLRRDGVPARLGAAGLLAYLGYTYLYHLLGAGFTDLLLLHAAVFSGALVALVLTLVHLDADDVAHAIAPGTRTRPAAGVLAVLALALGAMWAYYSLDQALTGDVPPGSALVETETVVHLGIVLDLTLLVPLYVAAAVLLWRREPWGYVLGVIALVAGLLHQVSYVVALLMQSVTDVDGAVAFDPVEPVIIALYAAAAASLLLGLRRRVNASPHHGAAVPRQGLPGDRATVDPLTTDRPPTVAPSEPPRPRRPR